MKRFVIGLSTAILVSAFTCATVWAQATAQIDGTVKDQTGAVLPGAEIAVTQTDTGTTRNALTDETGAYTLPNLPLGPYRLEVGLPGFKTFVQTGIVLQVNSNPVIHVVLEVGQVTEQVEVQANAAMVETRTVGVAQIMDNERILELPLNGRQVSELVLSIGSAVQSGTPAAMNFDGGRFVSVGGGLGFGVAYNLDGAMHNDPYSGLPHPFPFPDAVQEFKVETSGLSASNGGQAGASVNSVTKSGTNEFHGNLFEFARNDLFNARPYFSTKGSTLKRHQFGGTLGGPIIQNKLFFFGGYQGTTLREDPSDVRSFVPTPAMLAGDFTTFASPSCNASRQVNLTSPFTNNRIDPALYSKAALNIVSRLPTTNDPCGEVTYGNRNYRDDHQIIGKADFQHTDKHALFGRFMSTWYDVAVPYALSQNLLSSNQRGFSNISHALTVGSTYLISPNTVNSFRAAASMTSVGRLGANIFQASDVGVNIYSYVPDYMLVSITGGFNIGTGTATTSKFDNASVQIADDISLVRGNHQFSFGGNLSRTESNGVSNVRSPGSFSFNGTVTGLGMADYLIGRPNQFTQSGPATMITHRWYVGMYGQDTWKVTPRVTLNYGLRWEPYFPQVLEDGHIYNFSLDRFRRGIKSTVFPKAPAGMYYPGDPDFPGHSSNYTDWTTFGPRAGLAWDVSGDGRTSVRASYGIAYNFKPLVWHIDTANAPPWGNETRLTTPVGGFENPWQGVVGGNPFPSVFNKDTSFVQFGSFNSQSYDASNTTGASWNLSLQRQVLSDLLVSATYMGSQTSHVWNLQAINPGVFFPGNPVNGVCTAQGFTLVTSTSPCSPTNNSNLNQRRVLYLQNPAEAQYLGLLDQFDDGGTMSYHGLLLNVQRRPVSGVTISGNYTWSHCIGDATDFNGAGPDPGTGYVDPTNRDFDRGNCESDRRHVFNVSTVAETPRFAGRTLNLLASGWRLSGIYRKSTGSFLTVTAGTDRALTGIGGQRANQVLVDPYGDPSHRPFTNYLNPNAFALPAFGTLGNMRRNNIEGLGSWQFDIAVARVFRFKETQRMEFRAEAFNLMNSFRPQNPNTALNNNTFGQIRNSADPRIMQFALKYVF
jgi:hypothetical protein